MEQSKSPKSCAYARLGKPLSGKHSVPEETHPLTRNSTGNIYEEILKQFDSEQGKYIRQLVNKNQHEEPQPTSTPFPHRRKSYADLEVDPNKDKQKSEKEREERETLVKAKNPKPHQVMNQFTPKSSTPQMSRSQFIITNQPQHHTNLSSFNRKQADRREDKTFLDNLNNYLQTLDGSIDHISKFPSGTEKLSETLKIPQNKDSHTMASKLEKSMTKIKQLKLKNHYMEKQLTKWSKREKKMKQCLYQMLQQIKQVNNQLGKEKKQRKRLEKIIQNFEMRGQQPQRKTINKHYNMSKIEQFQQKINQFSQNEQLDSSFRDLWKQANQKPRSKPHQQHQYSHFRRGILDSNKLSQMFKSKYHSSDQDSYQ